MRRTLLAVAAGSALAAFVSCTDDAAGPRVPIAGLLAVVPNFGTLQGGIVDVARGRFVLTRIPGGMVAKDTVIDIPAAADSVDLSLSVPVLTPGETFNLTITLITSTGDTVFRGGPLVVTPGTSGSPVPVEVPFAYVGTGANAAGVRIVSPDTSTFTGEPVVLTAEAFDSGSVALPGTPIGWTSLDTGRAHVTTDAQYRGVAVGGIQRGVARLVATLVTGQMDTVLVSNQPLPTGILAESGSGQSARADSTLAQPLVARVTAGDGLGVAGLWVRFAVTSGAGSLSADSAQTDSTGRAGVQFTLARSFQPHVVSATTPRLASPMAATFSASLISEPPDSLEIVAGDGQTAVAGSGVSVAPQVRVLDADGLPVPGATVTFAATGGGGSVTGAAPVTDTLGLAAVTAWTLGPMAGANSLTATIDGLTAVFTATGVAGPATQLVLVSGDAQSGTVGAALPLPLVVRAEDANANPRAGATVDWAAGAGSVSAPSTVTDAAGLAQVNWTLGPAVAAQSATATLSGTSVAVGFTATATPGTASRLAFTVEPTDVREDSVITPAVVVTAYDSFDNVAAGFTGTVQLALLTNPGGATLGGTLSAAAVAGVATFADLSLSAFGNGYALDATATGLVPDTSAIFDVLPPVGRAYWINAAGGNWSDGANWISGVPPGPTDTAFIEMAGTYTVTLDADVTIGSIALGGSSGTATLDVGDQTLTITDAGAGPGLAILPLGIIQVNNGAIGVNRVVNSGSFRSTGAAGLDVLNVSNAAQWTVAGGTLNVSNAAAFDFQTSGVLRLENDAIFRLAGSSGATLTYLGGSIEGGLGVGNVIALGAGAQAGELSLQADLALDSLVIVLSNGRIQAFNGTERVTVGPDAGIVMDGTTLAEVTAVVTNQGVITATAGAANYFNDSLYNAASGTIVANASAQPVTLGIAGTENLGVVSLFGDQAATLAVSGGGGGFTNRTGASLITSGLGAHIFSGILINESGADVALGSPLTVRRPQAANHVNAGTIDVAAGNLTIELTVPGAAFTNQGTMNVTGGNVLVTMAAASPTFVNEGTITVVTPQTFSVSNASNGAFTNAAGGVLQGTGTFNLTGGSPTVSNLGTIAPGLSPGVLTWQGNLPMGTTSAIDVELGGTALGTGYDQLGASGYQLTLDGALNVSLIDVFQPAVGDSFAIMTGVRSGRFSTVNLPPPPPGVVLDTGSTLTTYYVIAKAPPPPQIVFAGDSVGGISSGIFSVNPDGTGQFQITVEGPPAELNVHPRWSPDRSVITYSARQPGDPNQLHIRTADGLTVYHLTSLNDTSTFLPRYSPDGRHLAFVCGDGGYPNSAQDVCVIPDVTNPFDFMGDGAGKAYVTDAIGSGALGGSGAFAWNPFDADQLAVSRDTVNGQGQTGSQIFLVNFDGTNVIPLTTAPILDGGNGVAVYDMDWAPDGSFIAFEGVTLATGERAIFRVELADGTVTKLTSPGQAFAADYHPVVSPNSSDIIFGRTSDGWQLMQVPSTGGGEFAMTGLMNFGLDQAGWDWAPDGSEIVLTEDITTLSVLISKILPTTTPASFLTDVKLVGRGANQFEVQDRQPSWRP